MRNNEQLKPLKNQTEEVLEISSTGYGLESTTEEKQDKLMEQSLNNKSCGGL